MQDRRSRELDGVRGIACLLVLLDHCVVGNVAPNVIPGLYRLSQWLIGGVDLFFVLSGFLIGGILLDHRHAANYFRVFWVRRVGRIMPVYYLLMLSFFAALLLRPRLGLPWLDEWLFKDVMPPWTYPLFVQNVAQSLDGGDGGARWVASTWSLAIEEQFYLLLPPLVFLLRRRQVVTLAVACVGLALLTRACLWQASGTLFTGYFLLPGRMDALMLGLLGALAVRHPPTLDLFRRHRRALDAAALLFVALLSSNALTAAGAAVPGLASFVVRSLDFTLRSTLFFFAIVRVFVVPEGCRYRRVLASPALVFTGLISYSLYMYHQVVNGLLHGAVFGDVPRVNDLPHLLLALAVMAVSVGLAWLSTRYFEMPIRRLSQRVTYRGASAPAPAAVGVVGASG